LAEQFEVNIVYILQVSHVNQVNNDADFWTHFKLCLYLCYHCQARHTFFSGHINL